MQSDKSVGVVIPMFNVAPYLRDCLDSVVSQSHENFFVLLVDDGSTDETLQIAKEYVERDVRFILVAKENGGLSNARNVGIDYFKGAFAQGYESSQYSQALKAFEWRGGGGISL